jgi:hypothetical protein
MLKLERLLEKVDWYLGASATDARIKNPLFKSVNPRDYVVKDYEYVGHIFTSSNKCNVYYDHTGGKPPLFFDMVTYFECVDPETKSAAEKISANDYICKLFESRKKYHSGSMSRKNGKSDIVSMELNTEVVRIESDSKHYFAGILRFYCPLVLETQRKNGT